MFLLAALLAALGASSATASDATVRRELLQGVAQIRAPQTARKLDGQLVRTLARLRADRASTPAGRRGRMLAIDGFAWTRRGIQAQLDLVANDSGNIEAAIRHAKQADRYLAKGADLLRAGGRALGVRIGKLNGR